MTRPADEPGTGPTVPPATLLRIAVEEGDERRFVRWSVAVAVILHAGFFAVSWPSLAKASAEAGAEKPVVREIRLSDYVPPPPRPPDQIPLPRVVRVPIPDPTPDDPEPLDRYQDDPEPIDPDPLEVPHLLPAPPPPPAPPEPARAPIRVGVSGIKPPLTLWAPNPVYPETAGKVGLEGVVILECLIDSAGLVADITVLRGAPLGLTAAAVTAVREWRFEPSTFNGKPVDVIYVLTVSFKSFPTR